MDQTAENEAEHARHRRTLVVMAARMLGGLVALVLVVGVVANRFRDSLERVGRSFVDQFGVAGMGAGTLIADGFHFPIPPQFYMLVAIAGGGSQLAAFAAICVGSLLGGAIGFLLFGRLAHSRRVTRWLGKSGEVARNLFERYGYRAVLIASVTPIAYSMLCQLAGLYRMPRLVFGLLSLLRIPRLLVFYYIIRLGWLAG